MTPFSKKFTKGYGAVLVRIAQGDLDTAKVLAKHKGGRPENTCYLIQQAIEKAIKAVLCHSDLAVPLTHDLAALLAAIPEGLERPPTETAVVGLSEFATVRRYEEGFYEITDEEVKGALTAGSEVVSWATRVIGRK